MYSYDRRTAARGYGEYIVLPSRILELAEHHKLITPAEARSHKFQQAAQSAADELSESWPEGEGFGSSDMTFVLQDFLESAGVPTEFRNHKLERKDTAPKKDAGVVTAAMDVELAKAYADAWSPGLIAKYGPKYIPPAKLGELIREHWMDEVAMGLRNLQFRSSQWVAPGEWAKQMKLVCPEYNGFSASKVGAWLSRYPGVEVQPAREYSVCVYLKGDPDSLGKISSEAARVGKADEHDFQGDGTLRLWWD